MMIGRVCKIQILTKKGPKETTGVFLGRDKDNQLWLLCFRHREDKEYEDKIMSKGDNGHEDLEIAYTLINKGNTWFSPDVVVLREYGQADEKDICRAMINIYSSPETWKLDRCHKAKEVNGIKFWQNLCIPKGAQVIGGKYGKL